MFLLSATVNNAKALGVQKSVQSAGGAPRGGVAGGGPGAGKKKKKRKKNSVHAFSSFECVPRSRSVGIILPTYGR